MKWFKIHLTCWLVISNVMSYAYAAERPNILFVISDDQTWLHTSFAGDPVVKTPAFDRLAQEGLYFDNAYTSVASCAPSRSSILTGKSFWRNKEAGLLFGRLTKEHTIFTRLLADEGYAVGLSGKAHGPVNQRVPNIYPTVSKIDGVFGKRYNTKITTPDGISDEDYAASFVKFIEEKPKDQPFFFWMGIKEPHRTYKKGIGAENGIDPNKVKVPAFLPDTPTIRNDIADYLFEVQWADKHLQRAINYLEENDLLDNTLIVYTSDNGMPFPRAKATGYNYGVHMPLAMMWGKKIKANRRVTDFVNHVDFAPTFLEMAGITIPDGLSGKSLLPILTSTQSGMIEKSRSFTVTGIERHVWSRENGATYGRRVIHNQDWVYIRNYNPERWPMGDPDLNKGRFPSLGDTDKSPSKEYLVAQQESGPTGKYFYDLSFGKLPADELYYLPDDPEQITNLAQKPEYKTKLTTLKKQLDKRLTEDHDPRIQGREPWQEYPFYANGTYYLKGEYLKEALAIKSKKNKKNKKPKKITNQN